MWLLNRPLNGLFDLLMQPCRGESPWPGLLFASLLTAAVLVALFKITSNQAAIRRTRNKFLARTLELLLFQHDLRVSLTALGRLVAANFAYLLQFLFPVAVGLVPLLLIFVQMESWFDQRPLKVGETAVLTVELDPAHPVLTTSTGLQLSETLRVDSPPVRSPASNELAWRIISISAGTGWADVTLASATERKDIATGDRLTRVSPRRERSGVSRQLFSPSEIPLADSSPIHRMEISYPTRIISLGLIEIPWVVAAIVLMMIFSLLLGQIFGVRIA